MIRTASISQVIAIAAGLLLSAALLATGVSRAEAAGGTCNRPGALGFSRIVDIDTRGGPHFGDVSRNVHEPTFLAPKEVVLTFDDGPMPGLTRQILDTLDQFCTKATFFQVGRMAIAYPGLVKEVIARGHTVGTHTWSHPLNLRRHSAESARAEIEKGFAATTLAAGEPISPFFRFPGLNDTPELLTYLQGRGAATFTVDVISDDSYILSTERLIQTTLKRVEARNGGILLFHDIKAATARALPQILAGLEARGFKVVHLLSSTKFQPDAQAMEALAPLLARASPSRAINVATAFAQPSGPIPITRLAPAPRVFGVTRFAAVMDKRRDRDKALAAKTPVAKTLVTKTGTGKEAPFRAATAAYKGPVLSSPWATSIRRPKRVSAVQ